ncbi:MAG TPA: LptF/LptG family permease [Gemmataceae bacterium]|jgi:lipopolysaccharide export system permease protein|nr:LptF/LptG family permease [Gemmataceae bacterium]
MNDSRLKTGSTSELIFQEARVYWSILHRMIFWELARVFLLALVALTGMLVMGGVVAEASQRGLGPMQLLLAIPLLIPSTLPYTLPATTLFATCVVYGRLAHDNEILALKAAGIHLWHVVWPATFLGLAAGSVTFLLSLDVIPTTHHALRTHFLRDVDEFLYNTLKREGCIRNAKMPYTIYCQRVQSKTLLEALFMRRDLKDQHYDVIAWAHEAVLRTDLPHNQLVVTMRHCYISNENGEDAGYFKERDWEMPLPPDFMDSAKKSSARAMTWWEILDEMDKLDDKKQRHVEDIVQHEAVLNVSGGEEDFEKHVKDLRNQVRHIESQLRFLVAELHMRPALALGCLCFVLVGCPVGIWFSRSDYLSAFITCFLPIVLLYYPLMLCGINLAKLGRVTPCLGLWVADALMGVIALGLFRRLLRN